MKSFKLESTADAGLLIAAVLLLGAAASWLTYGFAEALRGFVVEMIILGVTFYVARQYLPWEDAARERVKRPAIELLLGLAAVVVFFVVWPLFSHPQGIEDMFLQVMLSQAAVGAFAAALLISLRYSRQGWGLRWPTRRELLVTAGVGALVIGLSWLFGSLLQPSSVVDLVGPQRPLVPGTLLWSFWQARATAGSFLPFLLGVFLLGVIGQELFFRVFLQARLAHYLPGRWALFWQAALFAAANLLPLYIVTANAGSSLDPGFALTQAAVLSNGVLAGYFWRKTGSLPLLVLVSLLVFVRWGL